MPHWIIKSALHRVASFLPQRQALNRVFQRWSRSLELSPGMFASRVEEARLHLAHFRRHAPGAPADFTAMEVGTGWYPVIPLAMYLCGAREVWTYDIEPLTTGERLRRSVELFTGCAARGDLDTLLPGWQRERLAVLERAVQGGAQRPPQEVLAPLGIHLRVQHAQQCGLESGSIDLIFSSGVLMLIPRTPLEALYREFRRIARPGGVMVHRLNLRDIYSYFDRSITPLNFLRFSPSAWRWLDSAVVSQNRLRVSDHRAMLQAAGFQLVDEVCESAPPETLQRLRLAPEFRGYSEADLLVIEAWFIATPA